MSIIPNRPQPSVSSVLSVRDRSPSTRADISFDWSDLFEPSNHLGCPSVAPEGETAERVARGVGLPAWDRGRHRRSTSTTPIEGGRRSLHRGVEDDVDHPRRPLPSKAHVQRSAVSVGFAAGRLTGTRGGSKADVDHSIVESKTTSMADTDRSSSLDGPCRTHKGNGPAFAGPFGSHACRRTLTAA